MRTPPLWFLALAACGSADQLASRASPICGTFGCDGRDPAGALRDEQLSRAGGKAVLADPRIVTLHVSPTEEFAWANLENGDPGDEVWVDRSFDGGQTWEPQLGGTSIPAGHHTWRTLMYSYRDPERGRGQLRGCGKVAGAPEVACTSWLPVCDAICDGKDPAAANGERPELDVPLAYTWSRKVVLHISDDDNAVWASIEHAAWTDAVWLDRDWDEDHGWYDPSRPSSGWDGLIGYTTVEHGAGSQRTWMYAFDDPAHGGSGLVRACGSVSTHIECTPWVRSHTHRGDPRTDAVAWLLDTTPERFDAGRQIWKGLSTRHGNGDLWWQSARAVTALLDSMDRSESCESWPLIKTIFESASDPYQPDPSPARFENRYYDDTMWWGIAWLRAFELSKNQRCAIDPDLHMQFLLVADHIWQYVNIKAPSRMPGDCQGILDWTDPDHLNADDDVNRHQITITNVLYLELTAKLYNAWITVIPASFVESVRADAIRFWDLLRPRLMLNGEGLVTDSIGDGSGHTCTADAYSSAVWGANYGVLVNGLAALARATGSSGYLEQADDYANAYLAGRVGSGAVDDRAYLDFTVACDTADDAYPSKGVFVRGLRALRDTDAAFGRPTSTYDDVLVRQPAEILAHARSGWNDFGYSWGWTFRNSCEVAPATVTAAIDAFVAADGL